MSMDKTSQNSSKKTSKQNPEIIYTKVDEAPELASSSLLPIVQSFCQKAGIQIKVKDISLAGRIIAQFDEYLEPQQRQSDDLSWLGELVTQPQANIIKLPNISASIPQIKNAIKELQQQGYNIPDYPENPQNKEQEKIKGKYLAIKGSAVNPVLRQGNSDRRVAAAVKQYARNNPHSMGEWDKNSKTNVMHLKSGDFYGSENSCTINNKQHGNYKIKFHDENGNTTIIKDNIKLDEGDIVDTAAMNHKKLCQLYQDAMQQAKEKNILLSVHLKATMMKVSDPIIFGQAVEIYFAELFKTNAKLFSDLEIDPKNGLSDVLNKIKTLPASQQDSIIKQIKNCLEQGPDLAMVDSDLGISNLNVPSDIIIDASMAALIRNGGHMWGPDGKEHDTLAVIPDRCYATIYQTAIDFCRNNGAFDPKTMGSVDNIGLMAQKAEEYGSHDKTFLAPKNGTYQLVNENEDVLLQQHVEKNDIFRCCTVKNIAIDNWIGLAINRAIQAKTPVIFWLDEKRAHDAEIIKKINNALSKLNQKTATIKILPPKDAMLETMQRSKSGEDTIAATGNVLRDYLTDLFPILELGTSAKMLSIVPLLNGGGLFETGAGGSAPKHVQQFYKQGHLRWDSLGEFLALAESLAHYAHQNNNAKAQVLSETLSKATTKLLANKKSPGRKPGQLSNAGTHAYEAMYWAQELALQNQDNELKEIFTPVASQLTDKITTIISEINSQQGKELDCGGYYNPDYNKIAQATRCSKTLNDIIDGLD